MSASKVFQRLPDLSAGACRTPAAAAVFRDIDSGTAALAVAICRTCPAATFAACREWAVAHEDTGIWSALSKEGLRAERHNRGIRLDEVRLGEIAPRAKNTKARTR